jgi:hypothetical protein
MAGPLTVRHAPAARLTRTPLGDAALTQAAQGSATLTVARRGDAGLRFEE